MAEESLSEDQVRLAKLWDAYEQQERELNLAVKKISGLESKVSETSKINSTLKKVTEGRDREIRELEIKLTALEEENEKFRPELERLEKLFQEEKERYAKLFAITEELEEEVETARVELEIRDKWFQRYFGQLENFNLAMKERAIMIRDSKFTSPEGLKPVKFEKVGETLDRPTEEIPEKKEEDEKAEPGKVKFESISDDEEEKSGEDGGEGDLTKLELVDDELAKILDDAGIKTIAALAEMSTLDLAKLEGVSPTTARKLIESAKEFN